MASNDCISVINPRSLQLCSNCKVSRRHKKSTRVRLKNCGLLCKQNRLKVSDSAKANVNTESETLFQNCQYASLILIVRFLVNHTNIPFETKQKKYRNGKNLQCNFLD